MKRRPIPAPRDVVEETWTAEDVARLRPTPESIAEFHEAFARTSGITGRLSFAASGRQALRSLLASLPRSSGRADVLLSAFNCPVVPAAVRAVGYRPVFYDFSSSSGDVDWRGVAGKIDSSTAAVIVSHFFGAPSDAEAIRAPARAAGCLVIEDCAHALGASVRGRPVGSLWDAAVFSFNYGKPISLAGGAALVLNNEKLGDPIPPAIDLDAAGESQEIGRYLASIDAGRRFIPPAPAGVEFGRRVLRRMRLMTPVTPPLAQGFGPLRAALGLLCLSRWPEVQAMRNANAGLLARQGIALWHQPERTEASWLRLRLTLPDRRSLEDASRRLRSRGFRAGNFNWPAMDFDVRRSPWAARAAACGIDVPIHQNMSTEDLVFVAEVLSAVADGASGAQQA